MSGDQTKVSDSSSSSPHEHPPPAPEHVHPNGLIQLPPHPNMYPLPPGAFPPLFFAPPPPEGIGSHGDANGPYQLPPYPQMMYLYPQPPPPPGQAGSPFHHGPLPSPPPARPKRKQVKMACINCASACKKCDDGRPCLRCVRFNLTATCRDGVRKERKKGVKRGPYKRKNRLQSEDESEGAPSHGFPVPPPMMQLPEGYLPYFLPPPSGYYQGEAPNGGPPPQIPFYPYHFTPFSYSGGIPIPYPNLMPPPPPSGVPLQDAEQNANGASTKGKKRNRADESDLDPAAKKAKIDKQETSGDTDGGEVDNHSAHGSVSTCFSNPGTPEQV